MQGNLNTKLQKEIKGIAMHLQQQKMDIMQVLTSLGLKPSFIYKIFSMNYGN